MPHRHSIAKVAFALLSCGALPPVAPPAAAKSLKKIEKKEDHLLAAGFVERPANTPERADMLKRLPADSFVTRTSGDAITYVYADPKVCSCLYVGTRQAYDQYRRNMVARRVADENHLTASEFSDRTWDWDAWGPWGDSWGLRRRGW